MLKREGPEAQSCSYEVGDWVRGLRQRFDRSAEQLEPVCRERGDQAVS
jgi:hypothetical protein